MLEMGEKADKDGDKERSRRGTFNVAPTQFIATLDYVSMYNHISIDSM